MKKKIDRRPLIVRLYEAAKELSDSCYDNFGSEAADAGIYEMHFNECCKDVLDEILKEVEGKIKKS